MFAKTVVYGEGKKIVKEMEVLFECDRQLCDKCSYPTCHSTSQIEHAVNFELDYAGSDDVYVYIERSQNDGERL